MARAGVVAGLCPMTEAMLGDGLFPLVEYQHEGGSWGIGTDSHYGSGVATELRILECGQRLQRARRNVLADPTHPDSRHQSSGFQLFSIAQRGRQSFGDTRAPLQPGTPADFVVLDSDSVTLAGHGTDTVLDAWLLSGVSDAVHDVMVAGRWVVQSGKHLRRQEIMNTYIATMKQLFD